MENGFNGCGDTNPKALLIPGTLPLPVHKIIDRTDDTTKRVDELPSTIDMDALKGPPPTDSQYLNSVGWKISQRAKVSERPSSTPVVQEACKSSVSAASSVKPNIKEPIQMQSANVSVIKQVTSTKPSAEKSRRRDSSDVSESSSDSEDSASSSSSTNSGSTTEDSTSSEESSSGNSISTKSGHSLRKNKQVLNGKRDAAKSQDHGSTTSSSNSNSSSLGASISAGPEVTIIPNNGGLRRSISGSTIEQPKQMLLTSPSNSASASRRSASAGRTKIKSNESTQKTYAVNSNPDSFKITIQSLVSKIQQKNGDLTITPISAPSNSSNHSHSVSSSPKLPVSDVSVTSIVKSSGPSLTKPQTSICASTSPGRKKRNITSEESKLNGTIASVFTIDGSHAQQQQSNTEARQRLPPKKRLVHHSQFQDKEATMSKDMLHSSVLKTGSTPTNSVQIALNQSPKISNDLVKVGDGSTNNNSSVDKPLNGHGQPEDLNIFQTIGERKAKGALGKAFPTFADLVPPSVTKKQLLKINKIKTRVVAIVRHKKKDETKAVKAAKKSHKKLKGIRKSSRISTKSTPKVNKLAVQTSPANKKAAIIENIFSPKRNPPVSGIRTKAELKEVKPTPPNPVSPKTKPIPVPLPAHLLSPKGLDKSTDKRKFEDIHCNSDEEENAKRFKRDLEEFIESPSKPIEIVDATSLVECSVNVNNESDHSITKDLEELLETPSMPIDVLDASEFPHPRMGQLDDSTGFITSPSSAQVLVSPTFGSKKRRKMNRTGFPSKRKKRKSQQRSSIYSNLKPTLPVSLFKASTVPKAKSNPFAPQVEAAKVEVDVGEPVKKRRGRKRKYVPSKESEKQKLDKSESVVQETATDAFPPPALPSSSNQSNTTSFTPTLTERIKIRKRNSMDGSTSSGSSSEKQFSSHGIPVSLLNLSDPPIIMPEKTNFVVAGLMSKYYKQASRQDVLNTFYEAEVASRIESSDRSKDESRVNEILPPPSYSSSYFRERQVDYLLPYNIWCFGVIKAKEKFDQWKVEQEILLKERKELKNQGKRRVSEPGPLKIKKVQLPEVIPESWNFKKIRQNTYLGYNKPPVTTEPEVDQLCECVESEFKCSGDDCLNRLVFTECPAACGENCRNRRLQKHEWALGLKQYLTEDKGYGVRTENAISKCSFILEYVGEVVPDAVFKERMHTIYASDTHHYCLQLDAGRVIDGHRSGGLGRFVNHSCEPNCEMQKWSVSGLSRMGLFALRDIQPGEELSYDYNFSLYNPSEGQPCFCGSQNCRGVIGGRTKQNGKVELISTSKRKSANRKGPHAPKDSVAGGHAEPAVLEKMKMMSRKEKQFIYTTRCLLVRNYEKIRRVRGEVKDKYGDRLEKIMSSWILRFKVGSNKNKPVHLPDEDPELVRLAKMAQVFYDLFATVSKAKDESGKYLCEPFMEPPIKRKFPQFYTNFENGSTLNGLKSVEKGILRGEYKTIQQLEADIALILNRFSIAFEVERPEVKNLVPKIKLIYKEQKQKAILALEPFIIPTGREADNIAPVALNQGGIDTSLLPKFVEPKPSEDIIRCGCGTFAEDGYMIQCDKCNVWQHWDCMKIPGTEGPPPCSGEKTEFPYNCELCEPREVDMDILLNLSTKPSYPDYTLYLTLKREDGFIVRKNDTVYVLRAWPDDQKFLPDGTEKPRKTYLNAGPLVPSECDIVRVEELRKDSNGTPFIWGYNYLRPYETYHEPSRRFYPNEILRAPIVELIPLDLIHGHCWVVDSATYCKGRPKGCVEEHLYICDTRVDRAARVFSKIGKGHSQNYCTKDFAFDHFETKLKIQRNFHPHGPPSPDFKIKLNGTPGMNTSGIGNDKFRGRFNKTDDKAKYKNSSLQDAKKRYEKREKIHRSIDLLHLRIPNFNEDRIDLSQLFSQRKVKKLQF